MTGRKLAPDLLPVILLIKPLQNPRDICLGGFARLSLSGGRGWEYILKSRLLLLSNHPAWRDEGGVIHEVMPFSGLPWPGVQGGILPPVSFQP